MKKGGRRISRLDKTIAIRVKTLMDQADWDQKDLASAFALSEGYVSRILSGERPWPIGLVFKTAELLNVPVHDIDPGLEETLLEELENLELRRDVPQLEVLCTVIRTLPKILDPDDLSALNRTLTAFAERGSRR